MSHLIVYKLNIKSLSNFQIDIKKAISYNMASAQGRSVSYFFGDVRGVMIIVGENEHVDISSNPGPG